MPQPKRVTTTVGDVKKSSKEADAAIREAVQVSQQGLADALALRNDYLAFLVYGQGVSVAAAARRIGISRQMARRILGHVDNETLGGVNDAIRRLHGAPLDSWLRRMDSETREALRQALVHAIEHATPES
jgi:hypothetical protein